MMRDDDGSPLVGKKEEEVLPPPCWKRHTQEGTT